MTNNFKKIPTNFTVDMYGDVQELNETLSKCRVRIFYKGMNRNRTYITEDFANQLINSLPYAPIKGIYDKEEVDFTDHGWDNTDGKIYGVIPADPKFSWEEHLDEDGEVRSYACADVILFTGLYPEAKLISGSSQSMEIFSKTVEGEWKVSETDHMPYFEFTSGSLVGLQVLGEETEPCFEGAAFFSLCKDIKELMNYINNSIKEKEGEIMEKELLNETLTEEIETPVLDNTVEEPATEEAPALENAVEEEVAETVEEETSVEEPVAEEENAVEEEEVSETVEEISTEEEVVDFGSKIAELEAKIVELENANSAFEISLKEANEKFETVTAEKVALEAQVSDLNSENESLVAYKKASENEKKEAILSKYESHLTEAQISEYKESMEKFSVDEFKKEICTAAVETDSTIFSKKAEDQVYFKGSVEAAPEKGLSRLERLLDNYKNGGNK